MASPRRLALAMLGLSLAGCQASPPAPPESVAAPPEASGWRAAVRETDMARIERLDSAWADGLAEARARGFGRQIAAEGTLLVPDAAMPRAQLPPGSYRCRLIRLGAGERRAAFTAYPSYFCYIGVEDDLLAFTKQTGSERPGGYIWADGDQRGIFLGAMAEGAEAALPAYGQDAARDMAGLVERVGPFRYRLVLPWPQNGAKIDILELIPAVPDSG